MNETKQNYETPKITRKLRHKGDTISERTVGKYVKEIGIRAQWLEELDAQYYGFRF